MPSNQDMIDSILDKYSFDEAWREIEPTYRKTKVRLVSINGLEATGMAKLHKKDTDMRTEATGAYIANVRAVMQIINNSISLEKTPINLTREEFEFVVDGRLCAALRMDLSTYISDKEAFYKRIRLQRQGKTGVKIQKVDMDAFKKAQAKINGGK